MKNIGLAIVTASALVLGSAYVAASHAADKTGTTNVTFYNAKASNQHLASSVMGAPVKNKQDEEIGDVNDAVIDESGKVAALVVGVGGFLGVGEKDVAVDLDSVTIEQDEDKNVVVRIDASKQLLEKATAFKTSDTQATLSKRWDRLQKNIQEKTEELKKQMSDDKDSKPKTQ